MFGIHRSKLSKYVSSVIMYIGIGTDQLTPFKIKHLVSDYTEESLAFNANQHNINPQQASYMKNFNDSSIRKTKIIKNDFENYRADITRK